MPANELKPCSAMGGECRGCPDCPGASSTGLKSGDITNEAAREELELRDDAHDPETATCPGCGKRGESNQKDGGFYCYGSDRCCP